jgi:hypothetical protein
MIKKLFKSMKIVIVSQSFLSSVGSLEYITAGLAKN